MGKEDALFGAGIMIGIYGLTEQSMYAFCATAERVGMTPEEIERRLKTQADRLIKDFVSKRREPMGVDN